MALLEDSSRQSVVVGCVVVSFPLLERLGRLDFFNLLLFLFLLLQIDISLSGGVASRGLASAVGSLVLNFGGSYFVLVLVGSSSATLVS